MVQALGLRWRYGQQALAARTRCEAGEVLLRLVHLNPAEARRRRLRVPLQIEVIEPDLLEETLRFGPTPGSDRTIQGIEHDANGQRIAYRLLRRHPGEGYGFTGSQLDDPIDRVPAADIIHLWRRFNARPQQVRGVPDSAPALLRLQGAKVQALLGVFITTPEPLDMPVGPSPPAGWSGPAEPGDQRSIPTELWPGMVANIPVGSEPKFLQPSGAGSFEPFAIHTLMSIATAYGVTYDQLTGDLRQANYSSLRAGKIEFRRLIEQDQWLMHIPLQCQPVWDAFIDAAILAGQLPDRDYPVEWTPPKFEAVDPLKDGNAVISQIRSGLMTWSQAVSEMGFDPRVQADDIAKSNKLLDDRGIVLDSDPRRVSNAGGAQDPKQNAAVELSGRGVTVPATATIED
jgi:lambda family phage portal protein